MRRFPNPSATGGGGRARPILLVLAVAVAAGACGSPTSPAPSPSASAAAVGPSGSATPTTVPPTPTPTPVPTPEPTPTPVLAVAPLTGRLVAPELAARHPIAVMVDDHWDARPQSGFTDASVVWQAPAEGGIPRYMMIFAEGDPASVGPVRSARLYFVQWAAEWNAVYVHVGGSPQAMALLRAEGRGQLVFDADEFHWGGTYLWRTTDRFAPHNVYTDGKRLRALAGKVGAAPLEAAAPAWKFGPDAALGLRPAGARIDVAYREGAFSYRYDRGSNTWRRYVNGEVQRDRANSTMVAPKNVAVMEVSFGLLGPSQKGRLEAATIGSGRAWIATNGTIVRGTWKKTSDTSATRFFDRAGKPVTLTRGQTFVQVIPTGTPVTVVNGRRIFDPAKAAERGVR
ncbi:MAG TPA: DUF3048 domain-containing protein [Candidatus Nanopelagicales bacterium]|nr:DUF3048 domain-containing protein [Candidatus Nanopelagicales bacterium]